MRLIILASLQTEVKMRHGAKNPGNGGNLEGRYANYFEVGHNAFEFILNFGQLYIGEPETHLHTRVVTSPLYAKALLGVLQQAVSQYEESHGRVAAEADEGEEQVMAREPGYPRVLKSIKQSA